jgi:hypothetical protein
MGNIKYKGKVVDNLDATDIPDTSNVERVAAILGVQKQSLGRKHAHSNVRCFVRNPYLSLPPSKMAFLPFF